METTGPVVVVRRGRHAGVREALAVAATAAVPLTLPRREAVRAVDRLVSARLERHPRLLAARRAGGRVHLAVLTPVATATAATTVATARAVSTRATAPFGLPGSPAILAPTGLVGEALRGVELLFPRREHEILSTIPAVQD